jgi:hypothetical protein
MSAAETTIDAGALEQLAAMVDEAITPPVCELQHVDESAPCGAPAVTLLRSQPCGCSTYLCAPHATYVRGVLSSWHLASRKIKCGHCNQLMLGATWLPV